MRPTGIPPVTKKPRGAGLSCHAKNDSYLLRLTISGSFGYSLASAFHSERAS
jgi:hypothetical protein